MKRALLFVAVFLISSCAGFSTAPSRYHRQATSMETDVFGCWADVNLSAGALGERSSAGELVAVSTDSLYLLIQSDSSQLRVFSKKDVEHVLITKFRVASLHHAWISATAIVVAGFATGAGSIFVIPGYIAVGLVGAITSELGRWQSYEIGDSEENWLLLGGYARFPQGLLPGIPRDSLRMK